jgi:exodeoxyribonuclease III
MRIISWNINGINSWNKQKAYLSCLKYKPDIICLQELKADCSKIPIIPSLADYYFYYNCSDKKGYAGVGIYTLKEPDSILKYGAGRFIGLEFKNFIIINVYVPNSGTKLISLDTRLKWDKMFYEKIKLILNRNKKLMITGDFNVSHEAIDLARPKSNTKTAGFTIEERTNFDKLLNLGFIDVFRSRHPDEKKYTFWSYMRNSREKNIGWRLDYFLITKNIHITDDKILSSIMGSDHCPILVDIDLKSSSPKRSSPKKSSPKRSSPKRSSPKKSSPKKSSPKKSSPKRSSPKRSSPKRSSPKKSSPKRSSPKRSSPKRSSPKKSQQNYKQIILDALTQLKYIEQENKEIFKVRAYGNAISSIKKLEYVTSIDQVENLPGIGKKILAKIEEILNTGKLEALDGKTNSFTILNLFQQIHGVGLITAKKWVSKGYKTIKDLLKYEKLTNAQKISIKYLDELRQCIPRKIITSLFASMTSVIKKLNRERNLDLKIIFAGSYRRQKPTSNDVDCLVTETSNSILHKEIIDSLHKANILTDDLSFGKNKYMGIWIDKNGIHHRIDIEFCNNIDLYYYELLYFTGSKETNIMMREAAKKQKKILNQNGLFDLKGNLFPASSEKEIFNLLGLKYISPADR